MRIETEHAELVGPLTNIARIITAKGGFVADDFTVREQAGEFSCAIADQIGVPDRVLVSYPQRLTVPMWRLTWSDDPDVMEPMAGLDDLHRAHQALVDEWLPLVNVTGKLAHIRTRVPRHAVQSWPLRHHLADAGYPAMRLAPSETAPKDTLLAWHSTGGRTAPATALGADDAAASSPDGTEPPDPTPRWRLIPLKHLVNHDPSGAPQAPLPGHTAVVTSASSNADQTFENYGDIDVLGLLMNFGFVPPSAPLVHSVPVTVEAPGFGLVSVRWRAPRYGRSAPSPVAAQVPHVRPVEHGLEVHHLTVRPGNRAAVATLLGMIAQSRGGLPAPAARSAAEGLLDLILEANTDYYRKLDRLVLAASEESPGAEVLPLLATASMQQQAALASLWS